MVQNGWLGQVSIDGAFNRFETYIAIVYTLFNLLAVQINWLVSNQLPWWAWGLAFVCAYLFRASLHDMRSVFRKTNNFYPQIHTRACQTKGGYFQIFIKKGRRMHSFYFAGNVRQDVSHLFLELHLSWLRS